MKRFLIILFSVLVVLGLTSCDPTAGQADYKPVIYLYPTEETEVHVALDYAGELTVTYPDYGADGWQVTASPDGTLTDASGRQYSYLFWEGISDTEYDFSNAHCVEGKDTAAFLEEYLPALGLTPREYNEFIVFWLPKMQNNPYNLIAFQTDAYTDATKLDITPTPDTVIRVFMAYKPLDKAVPTTDRDLPTAPVREGFTVVEWGGAEITG
jgi:hypothetical protein